MWRTAEALACPSRRGRLGEAEAVFRGLALEDPENVSVHGVLGALAVR
jgi:hypothetical protein